MEARLDSLDREMATTSGDLKHVIKFSLFFCLSLLLLLIFVCVSLLYIHALLFLAIFLFTWN